MAGAAAPEPPWSASVGNKRSASDDELMYVFKPALLPPDPASHVSNFAATSLTIYPSTRRSVDALELSDALGIACIQGGASKRSRMEEQVFGKMSALSLSLDISNDGKGRGKLRGSGPASGTRGNKKRGDGTVHVKLDLGAMNLVGGVGAHVPGRGRVNTQVPREHLARGIWRRYTAVSTP